MSVESELLVGMSDEELEALAECRLAPSGQTRLDDLRTRNSEDRLSVDERSELDLLLARADQLTILKSRARYTLRQHAEATRP